MVSGIAKHNMCIDQKPMYQMLTVTFNGNI